jgi:pimeloyl-ACP methyl ester carboxylesterase
VLIAGAASDSWYWHLVVPGLGGAGCDVVAVDLPVDDESSGLADYVAVTLDAIGPRTGLHLVAQSMGAYTATIVAAKVPVDQLVLVAPMVPAPHETPGEWWAATGQADASRAYALAQRRDPDAPFDPVDMFLHDVDAATIAESARHVHPQADRPFADPWPLDAWPDVQTRCVVGRHDSLFPLEFQRRVVRERIGIDPDEIDSGHLPALSRPGELTRLLLDYRAAAR